LLFETYRNPKTPFERNKARIFKMAIVTAMCLAIGATAIFLNEKFDFVDEKWPELLIFGLLLVVAVPNAIIQTLKRRCPRCGTALIGEVDPKLQFQKSWKIPKTCPSCGLDQTVEFTGQSSWSKWS
jgi:rRNA maturation protein Nop10